MHTMKKTTRHEAGNDGRLVRMLAVCALWLAASTAQAQILMDSGVNLSVSSQDKWHRNIQGEEIPRPIGRIMNVRIVPGDDKQATIQFDAAWQGSWRSDINHDAAWIFFKVRPEGAKEWQHVQLAADRVLNPKGYACEGNRKMDFLLPLPEEKAPVTGRDAHRSTGMFVRQASQSPPCSIALTNVTAVWNLDRTGIGRDTKVQIIAVCLKMVYIAEGPFYLGSGGTETAGWYEYPEPKKERAATFGSTNGTATVVVHEGVDNSTEYPAYLVKNAGPIPTGKKPGQLWARGAEPVEGEIPATFPNGYAAFYVQSEWINVYDYVVMLNTVPAQVADALYDINGAFFVANCYYTYEEGKANPKGITREGTGPDYTYVQTWSSYYGNPRQPVWGMRWLTWENAASFAAWAGLRPPTELEFEKYMRGPRQPVPDEAHHSYWGLLTRSTRQDWPRERPVTAAKMDGWDPATFKGTHGLGTADLPADWPKKDAVGAGFRGGWCLRGGNSPSDNFGDPAFYRISNRGKMTLVDPNRWSTYSFRGARTAPVEAAQFSDEE
jgi:hypothetical protein